MKYLVLILLLAITQNGFTQAERKYVRKGNGNYVDGKYQEAELEYRKALELDPASYKADYNLGNALYKEKQYDAAAGRYTALAEKETDKEKLCRYYYNLGNTMFESKKYQESAEAYKKALRNNPGDMDAKHNLQLALKMLDQQKQQQNKDKQQNKGKNNENKDNKDQQNKDRQQDNANKQNQDKQQEQQGNDQSQPLQAQKGKISPQDAERILQALENEEKDVMKKVQEKKEHAKKIPVDKNW